MHQDEKIDRNIQFVEGNGTESPTKAKRMKFTEKARIFLFGSQDRLHKVISSSSIICNLQINIINISQIFVGFIF